MYISTWTEEYFKNLAVVLKLVWQDRRAGLCLCEAQDLNLLPLKRYPTAAPK